MPDTLRPGFITLHGNQLEQLRAAVFDWLRSHPLGPLEQETFLVQSNGVAEWLKIALAQEHGVCAATEVTLPGRFLWQAYRRVLGSEAVARRSALDRAPLTWRLMRLLPALVERQGFEPLRHFLRDGDPERRLQLAQRLADLFDQYQVYRADWLGDWARGADVLRPAKGEPLTLGDDQRWQSLLWRAILDSVDEHERTQGRAAVHQRFVEALRGHDGDYAGAGAGMPRRVVVFGISALPYQNLEALAALSTRMQVIVAVPNPCRYYWGDIISGRELLGAQRRRQALRDGRDLAAVPPEELHAHSHPLLAAWGRLGRDFIRMLDEFDDATQTAQHHPALRVDLFSEGEGDSLLEQVQCAVRDMTPVREHPRHCPADDDRSIEFHVAHSAQREVEVLHDRLLSLLAEPCKSGAQPLRPRDIIVMVPDIDVFSPAIRAVFAQYGERDRRHIPFAIADTSERQGNPLLVALDWLMRLPEQRCLQSEVRDLLDVPAIAARFGVEENDLPRLAQWISESGVRWGLDHAHRDSLGLGPAGERNAWLFGIRRMLLGYASGNGGPWAGIEPYGEVGGLDAGLAGSLAALVSALLEWRQILHVPAVPARWGERARKLMAAFFHAADESDRLLLARLDQCLQAWLDDCDGAGFAEEVPLAVAREAWLGGIDEQSLTQRFVSGGVTFCTLLPMRAVPFRVVCLLGMNDGDFPRRAQRADFDLLAAPGMARPGDRARREDDRYLMLEAVLSARDRLYISWCGRNVRDNTQQPPSVLVAQLRDYLAAGWELDPATLTTEHPLQPFSRRYFEEGGLRTWAREWQAAHEANAGQDESGADARLPAFRPEPGFTLQLTALARFIRHPVRQFFRQRLQVVFDGEEGGSQDDEPLAIDGLQHHQLCQQMLDDEGQPESLDGAEDALRARAARLARRGLLPLGAAGEHMQAELVRELLAPRQAWLALCARYPADAAKLRVFVPHDELRLEDWVDRMRGNGTEEVWLMQTASALLDTSTRTPAPRRHALVDGWIRQLAAAAMGRPVTGYLVGRDAAIVMEPLEPAEAQVTLSALLHAWKQGMQEPLPTACKTGLALIDGGNPAQCYNGGYDNRPPAEVKADACLARLWPDFDSLSAEPGWESASRQLYGPLADWAARSVRIMAFDEILGNREAA